jgi:hypothetical protein
MKFRRYSKLWTLIAMVFVLLMVTAVLAESNSTFLPNGAELTVSIDDPVTSNEFLIPTGDPSRNVPVEGTASVGLGDPDATLVYVIDGSGSTSNDAGVCGTRLQCEKGFVIGLNDAAIDSGSVDEVGVVVFGEGAVTGDMSPAADDQLIIAPNADSYLDTVVNSATSSGGLTQYTVKSSGGNSTNFAAGLQAALTVVGASSNGTNIVIFLSDGYSNDGGLGAFYDAVDALKTAGVKVYSVAAGEGTDCDGGSQGTLRYMANETGGECREVVDLNDLLDIIPDLIWTKLNSLEMVVDGGSPVAIDTTPLLPQDGAISVDYTTEVLALSPGDHTICVTAYGEDPAGTGDVEHCETIHLYQLSLAPDGVINELGTPGQEHTVTAALAGPVDGLAPVGNRTINFAIVGGPNSGTAGSSVTDAAGLAPYTYAALQGSAGLGTDSIQACVTLKIPLGETGCAYVTKEWVDTTPPEAFCKPGPNPDGEIPSSENEDGFYMASAVDAVWLPEEMEVYIIDSGSGHQWGPFPSGTTFKYTEAPGAKPKKRDMSESGEGYVDYAIKGQGDAIVYAVDGSGNESGRVFCLVPPPPK